MAVEFNLRDTVNTASMVVAAVAAVTGVASLLAGIILNSIPAAGQVVGGGFIVAGVMLLSVALIASLIQDVTRRNGRSAEVLGARVAY